MKKQILKKITGLNQQIERLQKIISEDCFIDSDEKSIIQLMVKRRIKQLDENTKLFNSFPAYSDTNLDGSWSFSIRKGYMPTISGGKDNHSIMFIKVAENEVSENELITNLQLICAAPKMFEFIKAIVERGDVPNAVTTVAAMILNDINE
jgi:hypothetical protein